MNGSSATAQPRQTEPISMTRRGPKRAIASLMKTTRVAVSR